jgi:hypothetical protein
MFLWGYLKNMYWCFTPVFYSKFYIVSGSLWFLFTVINSKREVGKMPVAGYKTITVTQEIYDKLEVLAKEDNRSVSNETNTLVLDADKKRQKTRKNAQVEAP